MCILYRHKKAGKYPDSRALPVARPAAHVVLSMRWGFKTDPFAAGGAPSQEELEPENSNSPHRCGFHRPLALSS